MIGTHDQFQRAQEAYENRSEPRRRPDYAAIERATDEGNRFANGIFERIERDTAQIHDPRDRLARQVGMLRGYIREVCIEHSLREHGLGGEQ